MKSWDSLTTAALWYQIVTATIVAIITLFLAIYLHFFFRRGWTRGKRSVTSISCVRRNVQTCERRCRHCNTTCTTKMEHKCKVGVAGGDHHGLLNKTYVEPNNPPRVGDDVDVYFNPKRPESTMSLNAGHVGLIVVILTVVALSSGGFALFMYANRNNEFLKDASLFEVGQGLI